MEVGYTQSADLNRVRGTLAKIGMSDASVQNFGTSSDVLIRLSAKPEISSAQLSEIVMTALRPGRHHSRNAPSGVCWSTSR